MEAVARTFDPSARTIDAGEGTSEADWLAWPDLGRVPEADLPDLLPGGARAVVVAPHPDDEILSVGGLLARLADLGREYLIVAVTDGDASHPGSTLWPAHRLRRARIEESAEALARLGAAITPRRLGLSDGGLAASEGALTRAVAALLQPDDVVFTTWRLDGHPDHEATGRACAGAALAVGARLVEVPVWAWHWARPADVRLPWQRARRLVLTADESRRKRHAVEAFRSQSMPDPSTGAAPILRRSTIDRAARPFELLFA